MMRRFQAFIVHTALISCTVAQELTDSQIGTVNARLSDSARTSWELGTRAQTILELNVPTYSVFSDQKLPPPSSPSSSDGSALQPVFGIAKSAVTSRPQKAGSQPLVQDGSAADPASLGVAFLIAGLTGQDQGQVDYAGAAKEQVDFLFSSAVPKSSDGALSHRADSLQLWSDSVYMVPPFLAYYGVVNKNKTMVAEAYNQIKLYRNHLRDSKQNMWRHIALSDSTTDNGFWSTGNGWAAAGILRVWATMKNSDYSGDFKNEQKDLANWVNEIHSGIYAHLDNTNLLTNYADRPASSSGNFYDASSTAFLASTVYRASALLGQHSYIPHAERSRKALSVSSSNTTSTSLDGYTHFTSEGWLQPVVNPHSYGQQGSQSSEGQAFAVQMHAAWKDWVKAGSKGANDASSVRLNFNFRLSVAFGAALGIAMVHF